MDYQLSKSEKKRRAKEIEKLVNEAANLSHGEILNLPCDQEVREEIAAAIDLKGSARKRQLKYATKLLREKPVEELLDYMARKKGSQLKEKHEFHELEHLRNLLIDEAVRRYEREKHNDGFISETEPVGVLEDSGAIEAIVSVLPDIDQVLLKNSAVQFARTRNRKYSRELFRILKRARQKEQFSQKKSG